MKLPKKSAAQREFSKKVTRSEKEITNEIGALAALINKVPRKSHFGEDNRVALRTEIHVISGMLTLDQVTARYEDGNQHTFNSALNAWEWLHDHDEPNSENWRRMYTA